ncbi:MAG TPA: EsaB/YukD family protein [Propionibacteriaceae bacterium]|jgi:type VII secretion integral membrane protein EccD|nr:EsaB/YukD family protein [Propionibacteriaceae bacterium]
MTDFTRLTVIGTERKAELVVPNDEAIGRLMPRLMDLLGEPTGSVARPLTLVRSTGEQLDVGLTAADQQILDGELLRIVRSDDAPPPPEVADVTDVLGESLRDRAGLWGRRSREVAGVTAIGVLALAVVALVHPVGWLPLALVFTGLVLAAAIVGRLGWRWGAVALTAAAAGVAVAGLVPVAQRTDLGELVAPAAVMALVGAGWLALGVGAGLGLGSRSVAWGAGLGLVLIALPFVLVRLGVGPVGATAITAGVAVVVCGVLPRIALVSSGLTGLDDHVLEGNPRPRNDVTVTVNDAYRVLGWATVAVAIPLALTAALLIGSANPWAVATGVVVTLVTALRTRAFPLAAPQLALWAAVLVALLAGLVAQPRLSDELAAVALGVVAVLVVVLVVARPPAHQRAFWRRAGNVVELLAVVALIPLLLGVFGVFADLLGAFRP